MGASIACLKTSLLILAAMALKAISASVGTFFSSDNSEKGTDFTSPVDNIFTSAICFPNTDFLDSISISFPWYNILIIESMLLLFHHAVWVKPLLHRQRFSTGLLCG